MVSAAIPSERGPLGVEAMRHGKDYMSDKPAFTTLDQLAEARRVQAETGRIYSVCFSERFENAATVRAGELVKAGAIGKVVQTVGLGPAPSERADPSRVVLQARAVRRHPRGHRLAPDGPVPVHDRLDRGGGGGLSGGQLEAFPSGRSSRTSGTWSSAATGAPGYARVDWYTPDGLSTWGDGRLVILGTEGYIELPEVRGHRGAAGRQPPVPGRREGRAPRGRERRRPAVRAPAPGGHRRPDGDRDAPGPLLPGVPAGARGAGEGGAAGRRRRRGRPSRRGPPRRSAPRR